MWEGCAYKFFNYLSFWLNLSFVAWEWLCICTAAMTFDASFTWLCPRPEFGAIRQFCDVATVSTVKPSILIKQRSSPLSLVEYSCCIDLFWCYSRWVHFLNHIFHMGKSMKLPGIFQSACILISEFNQMELASWQNKQSKILYPDQLPN